MNLKQVLRSCFWLYIKQETHCQNAALANDRPYNVGLLIAFIVFSSTIMLFFFRKLSSDSSVSQIEDLFISNGIPVTGVRTLLHLPIIMGCAFTLLSPLLSFILFKNVLLRCG